MSDSGLELNTWQFDILSYTQLKRLSRALTVSQESRGRAVSLASLQAGREDSWGRRGKVSDRGRKGTASLEVRRGLKPEAAFPPGSRWPGANLAASRQHNFFWNTPLGLSDRKSREEELGHWREPKPGRFFQALTSVQIGISSMVLPLEGFDHEGNPQNDFLEDW